MRPWSCRPRAHTHGEQSRAQVGTSEKCTPLWLLRVGICPGMGVCVRVGGTGPSKVPEGEEGLRKFRFADGRRVGKGWGFLLSLCCLDGGMSSANSVACSHKRNSGLLQRASTC